MYKVNEKSQLQGCGQGSLNCLKYLYRKLKNNTIKHQ